MTVEQIKVGFDNFTYIIYCPKTQKAAIVDPGYDPAKITNFIYSKKLDLKYIITTHYHIDHTNALKEIKNSFISTKVVASLYDGKKLPVDVDIYVKDNDTLTVGEVSLKFIETPGHTPGGICIVVENESLITGDTLFIGDCGRTDLPGGNINDMYKSLHEKIKSLPDHLIVYPGHDYGEKPFDTLGNQKIKNKTLVVKSIKEFRKIP